MADVTLDIEADDDTRAGISSAKRAFESFGKVAIASATGIGAAIAGAFAIEKITSFFTEGLGAAREAQQAEARLQAVLEATGQTAGYSKDQLIAMADGLEDLTGVSGEAIMAIQTLLMGFENVRGESFRDVTAAALDFAAATGQDATGAAKLLGKALNDPIRGMEQMREMGVLFTKEQRAMIEEMVNAGDAAGAQAIMIEQLQGKFGGAAEAMMTPWQKVEVILGRVQESIGNVFLPLIDTAANYLAEKLPAAIDVVVDKLAWMLAAGETVWEQFSDVTESAWVNFVLNIEKAIGAVEHFFGEVLPEYLSWLGDNWANILVDMSNYELTVLKNMWTNISEFFESVLKWLRGESVDFKWTGLTEGFQSSLDELPQIAERSKSLTERALENQLDAVNKRLATGMADRVNKYRDALGDALGIGTDATDMSASYSNEYTGLTTKEDKDAADKSSEGSGADSGSPAGSLVGLEELASKIASSAAGSSQEDKTRETIAKKGDETVTATKEVVTATKGGFDQLIALTQRLVTAAEQGEIIIGA